MIVGNARHIRNVPGRKTDVKDAEWIADLVRHGLIAKSFVPPRPLREMRELLRYRRKLTESQFSVVLVDDQSTDGTTATASAAANAVIAHDRLRIVSGTNPPSGWTGKTWAMRQGLAAIEARDDSPKFVLFSDADIRYAPHVLSRLVAIARARGSVLTSLMVKLKCESAAERWLAPAFIFFFQMLYPFLWVNDPGRRTAAAAGGCMLVRTRGPPRTRWARGARLVPDR